MERSVTMFLLDASSFVTNQCSLYFKCHFLTFFRRKSNNLRAAVLLFLCLNLILLTPETKGEENTTSMWYDFGDAETEYEDNVYYTLDTAFNASSTSFPSSDSTTASTTRAYSANTRTIGFLMGEDSVPFHHALALLQVPEEEEEDMSFVGVNITDMDANLDNYRAAIKRLGNGIDTLIGPYSLTMAVATQHLRIPYFVTSLVPKDQPKTPFLVQLFPNATMFAQSVEDMLTYYGLKRIVVFFDSEGGEIILERLAGIQRLEVTAARVTRKNYRQVRNHLKTVRNKHFTSFVTILSNERTRYVLNQAVSLSMFSSPNKWLLVNLGLDEFGLKRYVDSHANMTVIRLMMDHTSRQCNLTESKINLKLAAFHDSVQLYTNLLDSLPNRTSKRRRMGRKVRKLKMDGCTGNLKFSIVGERTESFLQLMTLNGYRKGHSGTWRSKPKNVYKRVDPYKSYSSVSNINENVFGANPLRITINMVPPFVQKKGPNSVENAHPIFEGFCIDILVELSKLLGFNFNITEVPDGKFGSLKPYGWTGMIKELVEDRADIALAPFQMSIKRAAVVDFTKPFMTKGTTVVVKRPEQKIWMFQFLSPFSKVVWFAIFISFVGVSLILFAVSRVNSDGQAKSTSNLSESFWYIWGTLLRGSLSGSPKAISSRIVSSAWWFFCLILSSIYTANLAAFLTITVGDVGMNSAADLAMQSTYRYGTVEGSQTETFFNYTRMTYYSQMWAEMSTYHPESMVKTVDLGFETVQNGKYAFIWDSPTIRHYISKNCKLMEVGSPFDLKGYGFAHQKDAPYGEKLSWALLKLNDEGVLYRLERKWWRPQICPDNKRSAKTQSLHLKTIAGMYVIIGAGALMSLLMLLLQHLLERHRNKQKLKLSAAASEAEAKPSLSNSVLEERYGFDNGGLPPPDAITYANHSPLQFRPVSEWS